MESTKLMRILKAFMGAIVFNVVVELWIVITLAYGYEQLAYVVGSCICILIVVIFLQSQSVKKCIISSIFFAVFCIALWLLIDLIKSEFDIYRRIIGSELWAGAGFGVITIYLNSVFNAFVGILLSVLISRWNQKHC